jgi:putative ABC transport system substrate-binding protein
MNRRRLLIAAAALTALRVSATRAQKSAAVARVGLLWITAGGDSTFVTAFRDGMQARGYAEGRNVRIDAQALVERYDSLPEAAEQLVRQNVDVIVSYGATATLAAHRATSSVPIVMVTGADPVKVGLVASLAKPGGNVTGVTFLHPQLDAKRLELLQEAVPRIRRVGLLLNPASATEPANVPRWQAAAERLKVDVQAIEIRLQSDIDPVVDGLAQSGLDAIAVVGGTMFVANRTEIVAAIARTRLPAVFGSADYPDVGGLMSYGPNVSDGFRQAAGLVVKILKGTKPSDIPFEQASKFELVVNARTAKALAMTMPASILLRADRVIN